MNPPQFTLKLIVFVHFVLTIWGSMNPFLGICYVYMNLLVLCMGLWSIAHHESTDSVLMLILGILFSILQDVILLCLRVPKYHDFYESDKFFACHLFSILQDMILLGLNEPRGYRAYEHDGVSGTDRNEYRFSLGMSVLNLILKPITAFLLFRIYKDRGGNYSDFSIPGVGNLPGFGAGHHGGAYENIDTPSQPQPVQHESSAPQGYSDHEKPPLH